MPATKYDGCFRTQEFEPKTPNCVSESVFLLRVGVSHNVDRDFK
jgi:hypothetical protein